MGIFSDDQGKTEKPTPGKLSESRNKGDTSLSKELVQGGVLFTAAVMLLWLGDWLIDSLSTVMRNGLDIDLERRRMGEISGACAELWTAFRTIMPPFVVFVLILVAATLLFGYGQIGIKVSRKALKLKFEKLNPINGMKKVFSPQSVVRTAFAAVKLTIITSVLYFVLRDRLPVLLHLHEQPFQAATREIGHLVLTLLLWISVVVTVIAAADFAYQRYDFHKRNMMTKQEVDDERKRADGDPMMKGRQKSARIDLLRHRMMAEVPQADVIITNPTHFSVALRYDRSRGSAPMVVAKGVDELAMRIRTVARENDVPLMEDPPLARALYRAVKVGQSVPEKFYQAVATVLSHVYRLQGRTA